MTSGLGECFKCLRPGCFHYDGGIAKCLPPRRLFDVGKLVGMGRSVLVPLTALSWAAVQMCMVEVTLGFRVVSSSERGKNKGFPFRCVR